LAARQFPSLSEGFYKATYNPILLFNPLRIE
jgi:hypothetical protein